jgi:hypothetical protein
MEAGRLGGFLASWWYMALVEKNGKTYYYRNQREGRKVRRIYVAAGDAARKIAAEDASRRAQAAAERAARQEEQGKRLAFDETLNQLDGSLKLLSHAVLVAAGLHRRSGKWRRWRYVQEQSDDPSGGDRGGDSETAGPRTEG